MKLFVCILLAVTLLGTVAGRSAVEVDRATVDNTAQLLNDTIQALYTDSSSVDSQFWGGGTWYYQRYYLDWAIQGGPSTACAVLYQWRIKHGYASSAADIALNKWLRDTAVASFNQSITHIKSDGCLDDAYLPNTEMYQAELHATYLALRDSLDPVTRMNWLNAMIKMTAYLIQSDTLPNSALTGWQGTDGFYINGNYELLKSQNLYQIWLATGDPRYKDLFEKQWAHTLSPSTVRWPHNGLAYSVKPTLADGSDGAGYLVEAGVTYGYDGDYTQLQSVFATRLYVMSGDARVLRLLNLLINQLMPHVDKKKWNLDATNGSRHSLVTGFTTDGLDILAWLGGRTTFAADAAPQFTATIKPNYLGNASQNWGSLYAYRGYGADLSVVLQADLNSTSKASAPTKPLVTVSNGQIGLSWDNDVGAMSYNVKRAPTSDGSYTVIANSPPSAYVDKAVTNGTNYYYVVSAVNLAGESADSPAVMATPAPIAPVAPLTLVSTSANAEVTLTWLQTVGATSYNVKQSTAPGGPYTTIATGVTADTISPYLAKGLTNGTPYYFVVSASNASGESPNSPETTSTPELLTIPNYLVPTADNGQVSLLWNRSTGSLNSNVKRGMTSGGPYTTVANTPNIPFIDKGLINGTTYYYVVSAVSKAGESPNSTEISCVPTALPVPANVLTTPGDGKVKITWRACAGATGYDVKKITDGNATTIGTPTMATYTDAGPTNGTPATYSIAAVGTAGEGQACLPFTATPAAVSYPPAATGLRASVSGGAISLSWTGPAGAASYNVERSTINGGPYTIIASGSSDTAYTDSTTVAGTRYFYVVSAMNTLGEGPDSNQATVTPPEVATQ